MGRQGGTKEDGSRRVERRRVIISENKRGVGRSKSRHAPHCRVLPSGQLNGVIPEPLFTYLASFTFNVL